MIISREYLEQITSSQSRLYAFIHSLVLDAELANDILQNTNVVLWEKSGEFEPGSNFRAWAYKIAHYQVLAAREQLSRDHLVFRDDLMGELVEEMANTSPELDGRLDDLERCLKQLPTQHRELIRKRYADDVPVKDIASTLGRTANSVAVTLYKLRVALMNCMMQLDKGLGGS